MKTSMTGKRIERIKQLVAWAALASAVPLLAACGGKYYQVTATDSGKSYYTRDIDRKDGRVEFTDKASGDEVTLDSSEVREITPQQYRNALHK